MPTTSPPAVDPGAIEPQQPSAGPAMSRPLGRHGMMFVSTMLLAGALGVSPELRSAPSLPRAKTTADFDRLAAAEAKRQRKAARRHAGAPTAQIP